MEDDPVVVTINGTAHTASEVEVFALGVPPQIHHDRQALIDEFVKRELYFAEAEKAKLAEEADISAQLENQRRNFLAGAAISNHFQNNPITTEKLEALYQKDVVSTSSQEYKVRHIMLDSAHAADMVLAKLSEGSDFKTVAKDLSIDATASEGGDLGWLSLDSLPPEFAEIVPKIEPGQFHPEVVQSQFGWHILSVDEARGVEPPGLAQVEQQLRAKLQSQILADYLSGLKTNAKVEFAPTPLEHSHMHY